MATTVILTNAHVAHASKDNDVTRLGRLLPFLYAAPILQRIFHTGDTKTIANLRNTRILENLVNGVRTRFVSIIDRSSNVGISPLI